jgi:selenocysteine-specific elongation factor
MQVRFYHSPVRSRAKFHVSVGHTTVMAEATFFGLMEGQGSSQQGEWVVRGSW